MSEINLICEIINRINKLDYYTRKLENIFHVLPNKYYNFQLFIEFK